MKTVLVLLLAFLGCISVVLAASCAGGCENPCKFGRKDGQSGKPDCSKYNGEGKFRNLNDPVHYWECNENTAVSVRCPNGFLYLESKKDCVCYNEWFWTPECDPEHMVLDDTSCGGSGSDGSATSGGAGCASCTSCNN
ncbi:unnamed protein product [Hermetia illucens]|uniref:Chitin-binding type-2 domain-containing protein n=1 Tax=Hermetia illucens TaxID=343691 RepID=A0A7R8YQV8_HERIL|nr:uncharacterized protein LOC119650144 [Hermetia illucens]CAD7082266.1 unnamed protein product [Hermetia illucens]